MPILRDVLMPINVSKDKVRYAVWALYEHYQERVDEGKDREAQWFVPHDHMADVDYEHAVLYRDNLLDHKRVVDACIVKTTITKVEEIVCERLTK